jgi:predicted transcriptional regulator with HTH domain
MNHPQSQQLKSHRVISKRILLLFSELDPEGEVLSAAELHLKFSRGATHPLNEIVDALDALVSLGLVEPHPSFDSSLFRLTDKGRRETKRLTDESLPNLSKMS